LALDDLELVARSKAGDLKSFEELIVRYEKKVFTFAYRFMGNYADAGDLAQETFIRVYQSLASFRGEGSFAAWLYRICANVCRDELRRRSRRKNVSLDEIVSRPAGGECAVGVFRSPEEAVMEGELQRTVQSCLNDLPDEYRLVLVMREFYGLSYHEIAAALDISPGTVKSRLNRGRRALREKLAGRRELGELFIRLSGRGG